VLHGEHGGRGPRRDADLGGGVLHVPIGSLADSLGVDAETVAQVYYGCLLFYVGCTVDAEGSAELYDDGVLLTHFNPAMFGTPTQTLAGIIRALAASGRTPPGKALRVATTLPKAVLGHRNHVTALCEVAQMLSERLGTPRAVSNLFANFTERWDGKGQPGELKEQEIPLALRVIHVARDAALQRMIGGEEYAARVVQERARGAFDPAIAARFCRRLVTSWRSMTSNLPGMRSLPPNLPRG
jgi:hypothetical protein